MVEVKNFHFLKRPFLTKKGKWFFVTLRGGRGGVRASVTFVTKKMVFFFEGFPKKPPENLTGIFYQMDHI